MQDTFLIPTPYVGYLTCDQHGYLRLDGAVVPVEGADDGRGDEVGEDDQVAPFQSLVTPLSADGPRLPYTNTFELNPYIP